MCWWDVTTALRAILRKGTTKRTVVGSKMMLLRMIIPLPRPPENLFISENSMLPRNLVYIYLVFTEPILTDGFFYLASITMKVKVKVIYFKSSKWVTPTLEFITSLNHASTDSADIRKLFNLLL